MEKKLNSIQKKPFRTRKGITFQGRFKVHLRAQQPSVHWMWSRSSSQSPVSCNGLLVLQVPQAKALRTAHNAFRVGVFCNLPESLDGFTFLITVSSEMAHLGHSPSRSVGRTCVRRIHLRKQEARTKPRRSATYGDTCRWVLRESRWHGKTGDRLLSLPWGRPDHFARNVGKVFSLFLAGSEEPFTVQDVRTLQSRHQSGGNLSALFSSISQHQGIPEYFVLEVSTDAVSTRCPFDSLLNMPFKDDIPSHLEESIRLHNDSCSCQQ